LFVLSGKKERKRSIFILYQAKLPKLRLLEFASLVSRFFFFFFFLFTDTSSREVGSQSLGLGLGVYK